MNRFAVCSLLTLAIAAPLWGQAGYQEFFESIGTPQGGQHGPSGLIASGWQFRNQSDPESSGDWNRSAWSYQGNWSLYVDVSVSFWNGDDAEASTWAILPPIPNMMSGDVLRFFYFNTQAPPLVPAAHLEVRYSPSGGTDTGSNSEDVGDFGVLLSNIPADSPAWTEHSVAVPGSGRLALRYYIPPQDSQPTFWGFYEIDNLTIGPAGPFCNQPVAPTPGQSVTWTAGDGPYEVCENLTIPAGATVTLEPGAVINVQNDAAFVVAGTLQGQGTPANPIVIGGSDKVRVPGTLDLTEAVIQTILEPGSGGSLLLTDTTFENTLLSTVGAATYIWNKTAMISLERCTFNDSSLWVDNCTVRLVDSSFSNDFCGVGDSYFLIDNVTIDHAPFYGLNVSEYIQPLLISNVHITDAGSAAVQAAGGNFLIAGDATLQGNAYPLQLGEGGLLPGSSLPAIGNTNNYILLEDAFAPVVGGSTWAPAGVPYVVESSQFSPGTLQILPGVNVRLGPNVTFWGEPGNVWVRGTPEQPVIFERLNPAQSWQGLQYFRRLENTLIDGGQIGARFHSSGGTVGYIDNCTIQNCDFGTQNNVLVRKTRFLDNDTASWVDDWPGALDGLAGGNSFEGNDLAVDAGGNIIDARHNWWGDPSGPSAPNNPGGSGDPISGIGVNFDPVLNAPPDFDDHPPMVHLSRNFFLLEPGAKVFVQWTSEDDHGVTAHRLEFDHPMGDISVIAELPGSQQAYEWIVPDVGVVINGGSPTLRVIAVDAAGQEGWDQQSYLIPSHAIGGDLEVLNDLSGVLRAGDEIEDLCWALNGPSGSGATASIHLDGEHKAIGLGATFEHCVAAAVRMPYVSTDTARLAVSQNQTLNNTGLFFGDFFTVRPDARVGDAAPMVDLLSPLPGTNYQGGGVVPINWTASDDEGLREFDVQASYDGGRTWHFIAEDLPAETTGLNWQLPPSTGLDDVRVRVIAHDLRFQNSSDGADGAFSILPGNGRLPGDLNGDGGVDASDLAMLLGSWGPCPTCAADLNKDDMVDASDLAMLLGAWN